MHEGRILYAGNDHVHVLRYIGDVRHPLAPSVSSFVAALLLHIENDDLVVDLSEAESIDSTNLGEIARIADGLNAKSGKRAAIISTRPEISQVLFSMAFDEVFDICTESVGERGGEPIPSVPVSRDVALRVVLAAHRRLMEMSESNRKQLSEVVDLMERQSEASGAIGEPPPAKGATH
jgi:anti-anti-sigma regulatory factor